VCSSDLALLSLSYSRSAESEADRISAELMYRSGHDPAAIGRFFSLIETKLGDHSSTSMLSTHPGTPERRQAIEDYASLLKAGKAAE
jgi:predicted Zn-dependent protease